MKFTSPPPLAAFGSPTAVLPVSQPPATPTPADSTALIGQASSQDPRPVATAAASASPRATLTSLSDDQVIAVHRHLISMIERTGWPMVQNNGQRRFGPPHNWQGPVPGRGCEVFIGRIPRDMFEHELFPIFQRAGQLYEMRLMMDFSGTNRGFGFAKYATPEDADRAVAMLNGIQVRGNRHLGVVKSVDNRRLFVGGLPKDKTRDDVRRELSKLVSGIVDVILYSSVVDKTKNRGFAFVEFENHRMAAIARRRLIPGGVVLWDHELAVDWAEPEPEIPSDVMAKVRVLYMRNLMLSTSEDQIRALVETVVPVHSIEKVKKLKDFAFLHFTDRKFAETARERLDGKELDGSVLTVVWAKPPELAQKKNVEALTTDLIRASDPRLFIRGAGGLKTCLSPKGNPDPSYAMVGPSNPITYPVPVPYTSVQSNYQALLSFCRYYNLDSPRFEVLERTSPGQERLLHVVRVTLPIDPPNNVVTGRFCETSWEAQESAAGMALTVLHMVYMSPATYPACPVGMTSSVMVPPPSFICTGMQ